MQLALVKPPVQSATQCIMAQLICAPLHAAQPALSAVFLAKHSVAQLSAAPKHMLPQLRCLS